MYNKIRTGKIKTGFSMFELSVVILIISLLVAGVMQGGELVKKSKVTAAAALTKSSIVGKMDGLFLWYETTMPSSIDDTQAADANPVNTWQDISDTRINPINATQATVSNQPLYITGSINGLPALRFDGVNDSIQAPLSPAIMSSQLEVFIVCKRIGIKADTSAASFYKIGSSNDSNNLSSMVLAYESSGGTTLQTFRVSAKSTQANHPGNNIPYVFSTKFDGVNNTAYFNGTSQNPVSSTESFNIDRILIGARLQSGNNSNFYNGDIGEIIIFNRALKDQERRDVNQYLSKKWAITVS